MRLVKRVIIAALVMATVVAVALWYVRYNDQMRDARPILKLLAENNGWEARNLIFDGPRLKRIGARKVWKAVIKELVTAKEMQEIENLCFTIIALQGKRLTFQDENDWQVITAAVERYNARPKSSRPREFLVFKHEYDGYWLTFGVETD